MTINEERAERFRAIREGLQATQADFADVLNEAAKSVKLPVRYTGYGVSIRETGRKKLTAEDFAIASRVDLHRRSWEWLAFGRDLVVAAASPPVRITETKEHIREVPATALQSVPRRRVGGRKDK